MIEHSPPSPPPPGGNTNYSILPEDCILLGAHFNLKIIVIKKQELYAMVSTIPPVTTLVHVRLSGGTVPLKSSFTLAGAETNQRRLARQRRCFIPISATGKEADKVKVKVNISDQESSLVSSLKRAASSRQVPAQQVFESLMALERCAKQHNTADVVGTWNEVIGGVTSPGRRWQLVFTSGTKQVQQALKKNGQGKGSLRLFEFVNCC
jgi:hypothetical protein